MANTKQKHVFISHATKDDDFVKKLRTSLEGSKIPVWVDSRKLRGGDKLKPEIETAIENAKHTIAVLSLDALNSTWVQDEIIKSRKVEKKQILEHLKLLTEHISSKSEETAEKIGEILGYLKGKEKGEEEEQNRRSTDPR